MNCFCLGLSFRFTCKYSPFKARAHVEVKGEQVHLFQDAVSPQDWSAPSFCIMRLACALFPPPPTPWETEVLITRYMRCSCSQQNNNSLLESFFLLGFCIALAPSHTHDHFFCHLLFKQTKNSFVTIVTAFVTTGKQTFVFCFSVHPPSRCLFPLEQTIAGDRSMLEDKPARQAMFKYY